MIRDEADQNLLDEIGGLFIGLRKRAGLNQRQAAKLAESTQSRVSDLENGKADVLILTLHRWARAYGYDTEIHFVPIEDEETKAFNEALATAMAEIEGEDNAQ